MKKLKELQEEFKEMYDDDPRDWQMSFNKDIQDPNLFISNRRGIWQVKLDSYFKPKPLGLGAQIGDSDDALALRKRKLGPSFGFRPITDNHLLNIRDQIIKKKPIDNLLLDILKTEPKPTSLLDSPLSLQGPISFSNSSQYISERQKLLDKKLKKELLKLSSSTLNYL